MPDSNVLILGGDPLPGLGYPPLAAFTIPVTAGLVGAHFFSSGKDIAAINYGGSVDAGFVGNGFTEHDGYMTVNENGYLQTGIAESPAASILAIIRRTGTASVGAIGTYVSNTDAGLAIYSQSPNDYWSSTVGKAGGTSTGSFLATSTAQWRLIELSVPATGVHTLYDHTSGTLAASDNASAREASPRAYRIGRIYSGAFVNSFDIAAAVFHNGTYNEVQRGQMIEWAREFAAANGITV